MIVDSVSYRRSPKIAKSHKRISPLRKSGHPSKSLFMASPMQPSNEPVAISNPITSVSSSILVSPSIPSASESSPSFLKPSASKPDPSLSSIASAGLRTSPSVSSPSLEKSLFLSPPPMTTATNSASHSLNQEGAQPHGGQNDVNSGDSRNITVAGKESNGNQNHAAQDGSRAANTLGDSMVAKPAQGSSDEMHIDNHLQASPASMPNAVGATAGENATTTTTLMNNSTVASPGLIEESNSQEGERPQHREEAVSSEEANKSFSYPVPMGAMSLSDPRRGMSLPHAGFHKGNPRSPSAKKHRCPYCSTEFTRHHNLKSHLLTHSQEKPYVCQTCQSRFRRLHDLKRHTKLHTGERPHICPQCGRKFARGDALARHNKGQGGCAGRRSSMGSYGGEEEYGDGRGAGPAEDSMDGLMYTEPDRMDEDDERQLSMPSIKKPSNPSEPIPRSTTTDHNAFQSRQPSTYPPIAVVRPQQGGLFPPTSHGSSSSTSPISQPGNMSFASGGGSGSSNLNAGQQQQQQQQQQGSPSIFSRATMRESPKPLSPNQSGHGTDGNIHSQAQQQRPRSPSINQQYQQQYFGRGSGTSSSASHNNSSTQGSLGLPPPHSSAPQLPPPPGLNPPDSRYTLHSQGSIAAQQNQPQHTQPQHSSSIPPTHSHSHSQSRQPPSFSQNPNSKNSNHHNSTNNNNNNLFAQPIRTTTSPGPINSGDSNNQNNSRNDDRIWMYIRSLEEKVDGLQNEVIGLRSQIAAAAVPGITGVGNSAAGQTQDRK